MKYVVTKQTKTIHKYLVEAENEDSARRIDIDNLSIQELVTQSESFTKVEPYSTIVQAKEIIEKPAGSGSSNN